GVSWRHAALAVGGDGNLAVAAKTGQSSSPAPIGTCPRAWIGYTGRMQHHPDPLEILRDVYGYAAFRGEQQAIIEHIIAGQHGFVLMPTGGGKSLCYQIPSLCRKGVG